MSLVEKRVYSSESLQFESGSITGWKRESHSLGQEWMCKTIFRKKELTEAAMASHLPKMCFTLSTLLCYQ